MYRFDLIILSHRSQVFYSTDFSFFCIISANLSSSSFCHFMYLFLCPMYTVETLTLEPTDLHFWKIFLLMF